MVWQNMNEGYQNVAKWNRKIQIISRLKSLGVIVVLLVDYMYDLKVCGREWKQDKSPNWHSIPLLSQIHDPKLLGHDLPDYPSCTPVGV
jgi:hypothetical protein